MFLSGDIKSRREGSQKGALASQPLCLWATSMITEQHYLPQVFTPVCREKKKATIKKYKHQA